MKTKLLHIVFVICAFFCVITSVSAKSKNKYELKQIFVTDTTLWEMTGEIDAFISSRPNSLHYPIVKLSFANERDELIFNVRAVDNSWEKLFNSNEEPIGYFVRRNRLFLVAAEDGCDVNFNYFFVDANQTRFFSDNSEWWLTPKLSPVWKYMMVEKYIKILASENLYLLDKKRE